MSKRNPVTIILFELRIQKQVLCNRSHLDSLIHINQEYHNENKKVLHLRLLNVLISKIIIRRTASKCHQNVKNTLHI